MAKLLPALIDLSREEEVEDLRVRNQLLIDKVDVSQAKDSCVAA